jgi:hypothetical protein
MHRVKCDHIDGVPGSIAGRIGAKHQLRRRLLNAFDRLEARKHAVVERQVGRLGRQPPTTAACAPRAVRDFATQRWSAERRRLTCSASSVPSDYSVHERVCFMCSSDIGMMTQSWCPPLLGNMPTNSSVSASLAEMRLTMQQICGARGPLEPNKVSGALLELSPGSTTQQVRFAILANFPGVKVVSGESMLTSIRQGLGALLNGALALIAIMFVSAALMLNVLFSAIIAERKRELGLLRAIGARRGQIVGMLLTEAGLATAIGGLVGVVLGLLLMRVYEHSLVYYLDRMGIPFVWLSGWTTGLIALLCVALTSLTGAAGALYPAWRASALEPYALIRSEG